VVAADAVSFLEIVGEIVCRSLTVAHGSSVIERFGGGDVRVALREPAVLCIDGDPVLGNLRQCIIVCRDPHSARRLPNPAARLT
jgi:hypothetical protein